MGGKRDGYVRFYAALLPAIEPGQKWSDDDPIADWPRALSAENTQFVADILDMNCEVKASIKEGEGLVRIYPKAGDLQYSTDIRSEIWQRIFNDTAITLEEPIEPQLLAGQVEHYSFSVSKLANYHKRIYSHRAAVLASSTNDGVSLQALTSAMALSAAEQQAADGFGDFFEALSEQPALSISTLRETDKVPFADALVAVTNIELLSLVLSLTIEFEISESALPETGAIRLFPASESTIPYTAPATAFAFTDKRLIAASRDESHGGLLRFRSSRESLAKKNRTGENDPYFVCVHDVDATQHKNSSNGSEPISSLVSSINPFGQKLGDMRSFGFSISENDALTRYKADSERSDRLGELLSKDKFPSEVLYAEDITVGYRFDVLQEGNVLSLYEHGLTIGDRVDGRNKDGSLVSKLLNCGVVEGYTERSTSLTEKDGKIKEAVHETIWHWDGWSLSMPRPTETKKVSEDKRAVFLREETMGCGRLPRLTYGSTYRFAGRRVFLNGLGLSKDEAHNERAIERKRRIEKAPGSDWVELEYESDEILFSRSNPIRPPEIGFDRYESESDIEKDARILEISAGRGLKRSQRRWFYPPQIEFPQCELTGAIPRFSADPRRQYRMLMSKVDGAPPLRKSSRKLEYLPDPWATHAVFTLTLRTRHADHTIVGGDRGKASNRGRAGSRAEIVLSRRPDYQFKFVVPFYKKSVLAEWPNARPCSIVTRTASEGPTRINMPARVLRQGDEIEIRIAPGDQIIASVSSQSREPQNFTIANWWLNDSSLQRLTADLSTRQIQQLVGSHPMTTLEISMKMSHAVSKPLPVTVTSAEAAKTNEAGEISVLGEFVVDGPTVGEMSILGRWSECDDSTLDSGPTTKAMSIESAPIAIDELTQRLTADKGKISLDLPSSRAFNMTCTVIARSRYSDRFDSTENSTSRQFTLSVKNSAIPPTPKVRFVVPVYGWTRSRTAIGRLSSQRTSNTVRVYLDRPWCVSGDKEQLGVVVWSKAYDDLEVAERQTLRHFVSSWGTDPILASEPLPSGPFARHLGAFDTKVDGLRLLELTGVNPDVAGYEGSRTSVVGYLPKWDQKLRLWYADIEVESSSAYMPWIRFAFVRLQPESEEGFHVSKVAPACFAQIQPGRSVSVVSNRMDPTLVTIGVAGPSAEEGARGPDGRVCVKKPALSAVLQQRVSDKNNWYWADVGRTYKLSRVGGLGEHGAWTTDIRFPSELGSDYRLELREQIEVRQDDDSIDGQRQDLYGSRTVFIEHIPLSELFSRSSVNRKRGAA